MSENVKPLAIKKKLSSIEKWEIGFIIFFCLLVTAIIYFLVTSIDIKEVKIISTGKQTNDEINLIMSVTENAINKISNVLVVSTIFFTIIVTSVSIFQFLKSKDVDKLKDDLTSIIDESESKMSEQLRNSIEQNASISKDYKDKLEEMEKSFNTLEQDYANKLDAMEERLRILGENYEESLNNLQQDYNKKFIIFNDTNMGELNKLKQSYKQEQDKAEKQAKLYMKGARTLELELIDMRIDNFIPSQTNLWDIINYKNRVLSIISEYPNIKPEHFMANLLNKLAEPLIGGVISYEDIKTLLDRALKYNIHAMDKASIYRTYALLEYSQVENGGKASYYLEKVYKENYDIEIVLVKQNCNTSA